MKYWKLFTSFIVMLTVAFVLSACGSSLQKPTGLEDKETEGNPAELITTEVPGEDGNQLVSTNEDGETDDSKGGVESLPGTSTNDATNEKPSNDSTKEQGKGDNSSSKPKENPVASTEKPTTTKDENPEGNSIGKPTKPTEKPTNKPTDKPTEKPEEKPEAKPEQKPTPPPVVSKPTSSKVVYSIVISSTEVPLSPTEVEIQDGDSVLSALISITKSKKIQMDYRGGQGATAYVEGIDNVYEFDRGQGSGWMYRVNGIFPDRGAGVVPLQDGDRVEWLYTTNLGVDLNANLQPFRR